MSRKTLIALGSNEFSVWGDARETVQKAIDRIAEIDSSAPDCSLLYTTPAFPSGSGPVFVNAVMAIATDLNPQDLLAALHRIEAEAGRVRETRWGQRTLDLDLIAVGDSILPDVAGYMHWRDLPLAAQMSHAPTQLILPHPRMQDRAFVMVPLCDVVPLWVHPVIGLTAREICAALPALDRAAVVPFDL
ncbi:MAG: 2-amino-4-hydroxy-6-hydroxymethyldihydropteridine diphosphokinase [Yoonia sp.]|jgi:2-amino-4-hydroxy-6-hydroxymethyldihydropteridine diphosphokinase